MKEIEELIHNIRMAASLYEAKVKELEAAEKVIVEYGDATQDIIQDYLDDHGKCEKCKTCGSYIEKIVGKGGGSLITDANSLPEVAARRIKENEMSIKISEIELESHVLYEDLDRLVIELGEALNNSPLLKDAKLSFDIWHEFL